MVPSQHSNPRPVNCKSDALLIAPLCRLHYCGFEPAKKVAVPLLTDSMGCTYVTEIVSWSSLACLVWHRSCRWPVSGIMGLLTVSWYEPGEVSTELWSCRLPTNTCTSITADSSLASTVEKRPNVLPYSIMSVEHGADPGFLAVSLQVTLVINLVVGCCYFLPGLRLLCQPKRSPTSLRRYQIILSNGLINFGQQNSGILLMVR